MSYQKQNMNQSQGIPPQSGYPNPGDMPLQDRKHQVAMWQQGSYLADSGINSATASQAQSLSGKEEEMDIGADLAETHPYTAMYSNSESGYTTSEQMEEISQQLNQRTRSQKPNENMADVPQTPFDSISIQNPNIVSETSQMMNIINGQVVGDFTAYIPEMIKFLNDKDPVIVLHSAEMILRLSKDESFRTTIINSPNLVATLVKTLDHATDIETTRVTVEAIHLLSEDKQGLLAIFKSDGIKVLVRHLNSQKERIMNCAITTLHNLLLYQEGSKELVRQAGGLKEMVSLLNRNNEKFLTIVTDCLRTLALDNQESKLAILAANGPQALIRILRTFNYEKLLWTATRTLKVLSVCLSNKSAIVAAGGMQALTLHLGPSSRRVQLNCLWTIQNLSDEATKIDNLDNLLQMIVYLLDKSDANVVSCCAGILFNLTCNNQRNKKTVCHSGGIPKLLNTIHMAGNREEIAEHAVCALRHLTARHAEAGRAQALVGEEGGIAIILNLLQPSSKWPLIKAVVGLVRNIAMCPQNHMRLRESGAIHGLAQLLAKTSKEENLTVEGVRMNDILDNVLSSLNFVARDRTNCALMKHLNLKAILVQLQNHKVDCIKREINELLLKLSMDDNVMKKEEPANPMSPMNEILQSESLSDYEGTMLLQIAKEKSSSEDREQKHPAMSMFREDPSLWPATMTSSVSVPPEFHDLINGPEGYDPMYQQGPPSVQNVPNYLGYNHGPMEPMPGLDMGPMHGCGTLNYSQMDSMGLPPDHPPSLDYDHQVPPPPRKDNNQMSSWYKCSYCQQLYSTEIEVNICQAKHLQQ